MCPRKGKGWVGKQADASHHAITCQRENMPLCCTCRTRWHSLEDERQRVPNVCGAVSMPLPASLARLKRRISEKKWLESMAWSHQRISPAVYKPCDKQRVDPP